MRTALCLLAVILLSCTPEKKSTEKNAQSDSGGSKVVKTKHENGKPRAEISYKDGKQHGLSRSFDRDGNLILELPYVEGKREGLSKKYFAGGKQLYQTTEYKNDKLHGVQTKYRENGKVMSEARYENDFPCLGLKEYLFNSEETISTNKTTQGLQTILLSLSDKVRSVKYYSGKLSPAGAR